MKSTLHLWSNSKDESATLLGYGNIWLHPLIESDNKDGTISFPHGFKISADIILHCTGYIFYITGPNASKCGPPLRLCFLRYTYHFPFR
ncbi:hypothetical protein L1987_81240 [Smallanthus sonchifolius]|uniref:Uncharacterized protein n=1 Tax=Smallanthus sonchifolius TaxID=185202 RepID=A0ACB8YQZ7_9ASTR|nr:hypothetical protein L1987_81240 [Smallanthus sonchifolius]